MDTKNSLDSEEMKGVENLSKKENVPADNDFIIMDLPEVKDIPGQEHIHVPPLGELADTTISSDDEEGKGILDDVNKE